MVGAVIRFGVAGFVRLGLTRGYEAIIDAEDAHIVAYHKWHSGGHDKGDGRGIYAFTTMPGEKRSIALHRILMSPPAGMVVDHINRNSLDNRRQNLRVCSHRENLWNRNNGRQTHSGFIGVTPNGRGWSAKIRRGKQVYLGHFPSAEQAARAYDAAALEHYGEFAVLNFPVGGASSAAQLRHTNQHEANPS